MEIKYSSFWKENGRLRKITHGVITDSDLQEIIERKERDECGGLEDMEFESADIEGFSV